MRRFFKEFRSEILVIGLLVIGVALLVINQGLGGSITGSISDVAGNLKETAGWYLGLGLDYLYGFSTYDIIGWVMILLAGVFLYSRIRYRYRRNPNLSATVCPKCESPIKRTHRSWFDRLLSKSIKPHARRYQCTNPECGWSGLRHQRYRLEQRHTDDELPGEKRTSASR